MNDETPIAVPQAGRASTSEAGRENEQDLVKKIEQPGSKIESKAEETETQRIQGAEILETPDDGNFINALKAFFEKFKDSLGKK